MTATVPGKPADTEVGGVPQGPWSPACNLDALKRRAQLLAQIRRFFEARGVLEVETPLLGRACGTDPNLHFCETGIQAPGASHTIPLVLQTSPEFAMKRLLAAGSGSIYQICKAVRDQESGRYHNPEFTLLEWYRVGFGLNELMDEVEALMCTIAPELFEQVERFAYRDCFRQRIGVDPITARIDEFEAFAATHGLPEAAGVCGKDRATWLDLLFSHVIQPRLGERGVAMVYDYPALLPSLARIKPGEPDVAERVEVFAKGIELGNGFHELADPGEQSARFDRELELRRSQGLPVRPKDSRLIAALESGLPDCSGIAVGLDRLLLLLTPDAKSLKDVLAFPFDRC